MNVVELNKSNFRDISETLRVIADDIDSGKYGILDSAAVVIELGNGAVEVFGLGDAELVRSIGLLNLGAFHLSKMRL